MSVFEKRCFTALAEAQDDIAERLRDDREAARFYLDALSPLLDMLGSFVLMGGARTR